MLRIEYTYNKSNSVEEKGQLTLGQTQLAALFFLILLPASLIVAQNVSEIINNVSFNDSFDNSFFNSTDPFSIPSTTTSSETTTTLHFVTTTTLEEILFSPNETTTTETTTSTETTLPSPTLQLITPAKITRGQNSEFEAVYSGQRQVSFYWILPEGFSQVSTSENCGSGECRGRITVFVDSSTSLGRAKVKVEAR